MNKDALALFIIKKTILRLKNVPMGVTLMVDSIRFIRSDFFFRNLSLWKSALMNGFADSSKITIQTFCLEKNTALQEIMA